MRTSVLAAAAIGVLVAAGDPVLASFRNRLDDYVKVRDEALRRVPKQASSTKPAEIEKRQLALTEAIRAARANARQGDILTADIRPVFHRELKDVFTGKGSGKLRAAVKEGNPRHERAPGEVEPVIKVNAIYPSNAPISTVPPSVLLRLPTLPKDIEYRFVGPTLILWDSQSNLIIDFMKEAVPAV